MENQTIVRTNRSKVFWSFIGGAMAGGLAGTTAMLLYAPQSGKKTRAKIQLKSNELREKVSNNVEDALSQSRRTARRLKANAEHRAEAIQQRGQAVLDDQKERLSDLVEAGKTAVQGITG